MPSKATNPTDPTTMIRTREGDGRVYLSPDPPRLLATGRRRHVGREDGNDLVRIDGGRTQTKRNETWGDWEEGSENLPRVASSRLVSARTKQQFFFSLRSRAYLFAWSVGEEGTRGTDVEAGQSAAPAGPTSRWQRETARGASAVAFVEANQVSSWWRDLCDSRTGGPIC